jgi:hypothetical protein
MAESARLFALVKPEVIVMAHTATSYTLGKARWRSRRRSREKKKPGPSFERVELRESALARGMEGLV